MQPLNGRIASLENFQLVIGARATLIPSSSGSVHGVLFSLTHDEVEALYSETSVSAYRPETVSAKLADGRLVSALCFNLPEPPADDQRNPGYVSKLRELAGRVGLPPEYVSSIQ